MGNPRFPYIVVCGVWNGPIGQALLDRWYAGLDGSQRALASRGCHRSRRRCTSHLGIVKCRQGSPTATPLRGSLQRVRPVPAPWSPEQGARRCCASRQGGGNRWERTDKGVADRSHAQGRLHPAAGDCPLGPLRRGQDHAARQGMRWQAGAARRGQGSPTASPSQGGFETGAAGACYPAHHQTGRRPMLRLRAGASNRSERTEQSAADEAPHPQ